MAAPSVRPARLSYLALYNPTLGPTDETVRDQLVFYYSRRLEEHSAEKQDDRIGQSAATASRARTADPRREEEDEDNERLRQIGLAQGMVAFVK
jgi:hypothetical protein